MLGECSNRWVNSPPADGSIPSGKVGQLFAGIDIDRQTSPRRRAHRFWGPTTNGIGIPDKEVPHRHRGTVGLSHSAVRDPRPIELHPGVRETAERAGTKKEPAVALRITRGGRATTPEFSAKWIMGLSFPQCSSWSSEGSSGVVDNRKLERRG